MLLCQIKAFRLWFMWYCMGSANKKMQIMFSHFLRHALTNCNESVNVNLELHFDAHVCNCISLCFEQVYKCAYNVLLHEYHCAFKFFL